MTIQAPPAPAPSAAPSVTRRGGRARRARRPAARGWLIVVLIVAAGAVITALLTQPAAPAYLSPSSTSSDGTHALADVLAGLGRTVQTQTSPAAAASAATAGTTLVITSTQNLSAADLARLARSRASVLLIAPTPAALRALAPGITVAGSYQPVAVRPPGCALPAARLAGPALTGGLPLDVSGTTAPATSCYATPAGPSLVQARLGGRLVTVLGAADPLTNADLCQQGNAALAINLLPARRIVWLDPPLSPAAALGAGGAPAPGRTIWQLVPLAAWLVAAQLGFAVLLAALWRARRLGPLVTEKLPVVVHAAETVLGHGQLYQSRRARGRAAGSLRSVVTARICQAAGLPGGSAPDAVTEAAARRSGVSAERVTALLFGPAPPDDAALAALARDLDDLARKAGA